MNPFEVGDPYVEWEEANAAQETYEFEEQENMSDVQSNLEAIQSKLKGEVITLLVSKYDFSIEDAEETVSESFEDKADLWNENAEAKDLAEYLASGDD